MIPHQIGDLVLLAALPDANTAWAILGTLVVAVVGGGLAAWRGWLESPRRREERERNEAMADALLGEKEVRDQAGGIMREAMPGLVAVQREDSKRLAKVEEAVVEFRHVIGIYTEVLKRVDQVENRVSVLEQTHVKDIITAAERAATAAASTELLRMVNERDTIEGEVPE